MAELKKVAPILDGIIIFKLGKGLLFLTMALGIYSLADNNLPAEFDQLLRGFHLDPARHFIRLAARIEAVTPSNVLWVALGTLAYGVIATTEGVGLLFRGAWAGWLAISESAFFVPIELYHLCRRFSWPLLIVLVLNVAICWYLLQNRHRLFRHRQRAHACAGPARNSVTFIG